jgi:uncharacterized protein (TIGR02598 family)
MKRHPLPLTRAGFSLVEIALALALLAFAVVPLVALLPAGMTTFRRALDVSICSQIAQRVASDARALDFDLLIDRETLGRMKANEHFTFRAPAINAPALRYFDDQGVEIVPRREKLSPEEALEVVYRVNTRILPRAKLPRANAPADPTPTHFPVAEQSLAQLTIEVAHAPGNLVLNYSGDAPDDASAPQRNLLAPPAGVEVFTYSGFVAHE